MKDRDKLSSNTSSTEGGNVNRNTSSNIGKSKNDTSASFGQNIGRSENLNEPSGRQGSSSGVSPSGRGGDHGRRDVGSSGMQSESGRRGSSGSSSSSMGGSSSSSKEENSWGDSS